MPQHSEIVPLGNQSRKLQRCLPLLAPCSVREWLRGRVGVFCVCPSVCLCVRKDQKWLREVAAYVVSFGNQSRKAVCLCSLPAYPRSVEEKTISGRVRKGARAMHIRSLASYVVRCRISGPLSPVHTVCFP